MPILDSIGSFASVFPDAPTVIKIGVFFFVWLLLWLPIAVPLALVVKWKPSQPLEPRQKLPLVASLYCLAPLVLWGFAWLENFPFSRYGLAWNLHLLRSLLAGIGIGVLGLILLFSLETILGWVTWRSKNWSRFAAALVPILGLGLWIAVTEELIFRGFLFGQLLKEFDFWTSAIASSVIFSLLHLIWEGKQNIPQLPGLALMGAVLCLAVPANSGSLGLAWGLHTGWIWIIASLETADLVSYTGKVPDWLTGLDDKPLAGFLGLGFLLATAGLVLNLQF